MKSPPQQWFSPRQLARVVGASESSIKRWADEGRLKVTRTTGGHRRISRQEAVRFVRESGLGMVFPDLLGLPEQVELGQGEDLSDRCYAALLAGDERQVYSMLVSAYLQGGSLADLFDGPLCHAMHRMGQLWRNDPEGIWVEHRATGICLQLLGRFRGLLPVPPNGSLQAVGGATCNDPYLLPTHMAGLVLRDLGYDETNLGPETPVESLAKAARRRHARLVWLSVSTKEAAQELKGKLVGVADALAEQDAMLVVGGRQAGPLESIRRGNLFHGRTMAELAAFARGLAERADA